MKSYIIAIKIDIIGQKEMMHHYEKQMPHYLRR